MKVLNSLIYSLRKLTLDSYTYQFGNHFLGDNYLEDFKVQRRKKITIIEDSHKHIRFYVKNSIFLLGFFSFGKSLIEIQKITDEYIFKITFSTYQVIVYTFLFLVFTLLIYNSVREYSGLNEGFAKSFIFVIFFLLLFPRVHFIGLIYPKFSVIKKFLLL